MAGWSLSTASSSLDVLEILRKLQSVGFCSDFDASPSDLSETHLASLFDSILSVFLKEIHQKQEIRPLPAMLGDGRPVDLFRLYSVVREKGGYDSISGKKAWDSVAEGVGLDSGVGSSLKLVYVKYLTALDRWLEKVLVKKDVSGAAGVRECSESKKRKKDEKATPVSGSKRGQFLTPERRSGRRLQMDDGSGHDDDDVVILASEARNGRVGGGAVNKRKREALVGMLNWVLRVAKNPLDPSIGKTVSSDGAKDKAHHGTGEVFSQVLMARQAMFLKKVRTDANGSVLQKGQRVHPSIYEDHTNAGTVASEKISDVERSHMTAGEEANHAKRKLRNSSLLSDILACFLPKDQIQKRIPVGPSFQAKVPDWSGNVSATSYDSDDLKWFGTRIWPTENQENTPFCEQYPVGKGRQDSCRCDFPGSVECVRFHVAEKRFRLKLELGSAFHAWLFDNMGEEVALAWTEEEARKFKAVVRLNPPSLNKNFWDQLRLSFPLKGRKNLVSYYFNVFLLARRSYQNRVTPNNIDSDDEETEFGFLSNPYGHDAIRVHNPKSNFCAQNAQCVDLDD